MIQNLEERSPQAPRAFPGTKLLLAIALGALSACSEGPPEALLRLAETPAAQTFREIALVPDGGRPGWRVAHLPEGGLSAEKRLTLLVDPLEGTAPREPSVMALPGWVVLEFDQENGVNVAVGRDRVFQVPPDRATAHPARARRARAGLDQVVQRRQTLVFPFRLFRPTFRDSSDGQSGGPLSGP